MAKKVSSKRVASIAGRVMRAWERYQDNCDKVIGPASRRDVMWDNSISWGDALALAASVLSQTEPKKRRAKVRK